MGARVSLLPRGRRGTAHTRAPEQDAPSLAVVVAVETWEQLAVAGSRQRKCDLCALPCWEEPCIFFSRPSRRRRLSSRTCPPGCRSWRGGTRTRWPPARSRPAPGGGLRVPPRGGARRGALAGGLGRRLPPRAWGRPSPRLAPRARADTWHANTRPSTSGRPRAKERGALCVTAGVLSLACGCPRAAPSPSRRRPGGASRSRARAGCSARGASLSSSKITEDHKISLGFWPFEKRALFVLLRRCTLSAGAHALQASATQPGRHVGAICALTCTAPPALPRL